MYTPPHTFNLKETPPPRRLMVGLLGESGTGKTHSALTFPNPVVLDIDGKLSAEFGKVQAQVLAIANDKFCIEVLKAKFHEKTGVVNKRDILKAWIRDEAPKLSVEQTLVFDSWSMYQTHFDRQTRLEPAYTNKGEINPFEFWTRKIEYSEELLVMMQGLSCNVIVTFHELKVRDDNTGELLDKIAPLQQGKFVARIPSFFDEFYRCLVIPDKDRHGKPIIIEGKTLTEKRNFFWQIKQDGAFNAKSRMSRVETFIPAHYSEIQY